VSLCELVVKRAIPSTSPTSPLRQPADGQDLNFYWISFDFQSCHLFPPPSLLLPSSHRKNPAKTERTRISSIDNGAKATQYGG
jgi:hypothetical protein